MAYASASRHDLGATPVVVLATAHPGKFPDVVERAIRAPVKIPPAIREARERNESMSVITPKLEELKRLLNRSSS